MFRSRSIKLLCRILFEQIKTGETHAKQPVRKGKWKAGCRAEAVTVADIHASSIAKKWLPNCTCKCVCSCVCVWQEMLCSKDYETETASACEQFSSVQFSSGRAVHLHLYGLLTMLTLMLKRLYTHTHTYTH